MLMGDEEETPQSAQGCEAYKTTEMRGTLAIEVKKSERYDKQAQ